MTFHPAAVVSPDAQVAPGVTVGPFAVIESDVTIAEDCEIRAHATIKSGTRLGRANRVHEGAVIGGEPQDLSFGGGPTSILIGERNVFREGVTVHRSTKPGAATRIGSDCFIMAYSHIAHDDHVGDRVIIANNVALAGHVEVGDRAFLSGAAVVHQFCRVGRLAMIGGASKLVQDALPFVISDGHPARARGLNVVGLRRAGLNAAQLRTLKEAYRLLLRSGLHRDDALARMAALADPLVDEMVAFVRASKRGIAHAARGTDEA